MLSGETTVKAALISSYEGRASSSKSEIPPSVGAGEGGSSSTRLRESSSATPTASSSMIPIIFYKCLNNRIIILKLVGQASRNQFKSERSDAICKWTRAETLVLGRINLNYTAMCGPTIYYVGLLLIAVS